VRARTTHLSVRTSLASASATSTTPPAEPGEGMMTWYVSTRPAASGTAASSAARRCAIAVTFDTSDARVSETGTRWLP